ncbi:MAG: QueT transporter family protein [Oscillospiraceae bacterium]|nr:QueT transporter family protein [Oscillospiraceae bacterium]
MKKITTKQLSLCGIIAALYAVITVSTSFMAYGPFQFRISEALCILPAIVPVTSLGLFVGCLAANLFSTVSTIDVVIGSAATLIACLWTARCKKSWFIPAPTVIVNAVLVGLELAWVYTPDAFWSGFVTMGAQVGFGELVVMYALGLPLLTFLRRSKTGNRLAAM